MFRQPASSRRAIIDVGSNSVRLVIYDGPARMPFEVHNEKVQARLGRGLSETGAIDAEACALALDACRRFKALLDASGVRDVRTVATAAAREAANGPQFVAELAALGLRPEVLSGAEEGRASAAGVLSAFPDGRGVVGDLGGGSLELAGIDGARIGHSASVPLGVLRLPALRGQGDKVFAGLVRGALRDAGWKKDGGAGTLYLVGGAWRALGHLDMHLGQSAHPGVHGYTIAPDRLKPLRQAIADLGPRGLKEVPGVPSSRIPMLDDAAALLAVVGDHLGIERAVVSSFGLREGLLYQALSERARREDPLLIAVMDYAARQSGRHWRGDAVDDWIAPLFPEDGPAARRIRRAACHLAGVDLHPQSEARARHGLELAWLGAWIGITAEERALLALTLWSAWAGRGDCDPPARFLTEREQRLGAAWGQAIRLAERLSGGTSAVLHHARLGLAPNRLTLTLAARYADLACGVATKQLHALSALLAREAKIEIA